MKNDYDDLEKMALQATPNFQKYYAKNKKRLDKLDSVVHELHNEVSAEIDCLSCARCCKSLGPAVYDRDIDRIAKALKVKPSDVVENYLHIDEDGDYVFKSMPCPFLMSDNYCSIYEHRPKACREYPHTDRKKFVQIYRLTIKNTVICPIAYEVMQKLIQK